MEFTLENRYLKVTVTTWGAQVKSVIRKSDGVEHMWQADKSVWGYHAPILFPYAGKLKDGIMEVDGVTYHPPGQHGFARTSEHRFVRQSDDTVVLELTDSAETLKVFPWKFRLLSTFRLENDTLHHTLTVENRDERPLSFGIGYHPAFTIPFDDKHSITDYELRFSHMESPLCLGTAPRGLLNGQCYFLGNNICSLPVTDGMFDNDSHCMVNLQSETLGLYEKDTGRGVVCRIKDFPYCLLWSKAGTPQFICIEPWNSLPSSESGSTKWEEKPPAATITPGENWSTTLRTTFLR